MFRPRRTRKITRKIVGIDAAMLNNLRNAVVETTNPKLRVLHRIASGFKRPKYLTALALPDWGATARHYPAVRRPDRPMDETGEPVKF